MSLDYKKNNKHWENLLPVLDEHAEWFNGLIQCLFYPEDSEVFYSIKKPTSFVRWVLYVNQGNADIQIEAIEKLSTLHADLFKISDVLLFSAKENLMKPSQKDFKTFLTLYEEFLNAIRRLEKDLLQEDSGYDCTTGLRSKGLLTGDVEKELERLARQGRSFSIALARIDEFSTLQANCSQNEQLGFIKLIADLIKLSIRSFDDAYYMGDNEFILCLKQTKVNGGISALERLRKELEEKNIGFDVQGTHMPLSMSCCIAEPVNGDKVADLLKNLRDDLSSTDQKKTDRVLEYYEMSPLQRYVKGNNQTS